MLIDTHAHFYAEEFNDDRAELLQVYPKELKWILLPNIDVESIEPTLRLAESSSICLPMMGLHPAYVKSDWGTQLKKIEDTLFEHPEKFCAVGEIGMDLYWDKTFVEEQKLAFRTQIRWAKELKLPIAIHAREAFEPIFEILDEENNEHLKGVFHCFTGTLFEAEKIRSYGGFKLGIGGVVTYKNSHLPDVLKQIPISELVLETDAPYLPPVPFRGKRNQPLYVQYVADKLVDIYQISSEEVAHITNINATELFQLTRFQ